ncbi:sensor histidine kinase [Nocardia speluncae]|uniref:histidine kinase n=1 Tax=Nocardia speluncae TaxID=419477 RepID=A0A846XMT8_9NOCA|nr:histidine kinase [Nocardia speluncae]NKY35986.1 sensor histidine kinase [Nocardia speluncae]
MTSWQMVGLLGWLALTAALVVLLRQRRALLRVHRERDAATATAAQRLGELEVSTERLVIARELHDVVAHNLSLINVQSGMALQQVENKSAKAAGTVAEIKTTSRNALEDVQALRHAIQSVEPAEPARPDRERPGDSGAEREKRARRGGFGRRDRSGITGPAGITEPAGRSASPPAAPAPPPREPDPTMSDLEELLRKPRLAGLTVHTKVVGTAGSLPAAIDEAATQIITESLANVTRHAPSAEATVTVRFTADSVDLTIDNTRPTGKPEHTGPTRGMGIIAMRERTHALGGALTAGPKPSGGFRVAARLPSRPLRIAIDPDKTPRSRAGMGSGSDENKRTTTSSDRSAIRGNSPERVETGPVTTD